MPNTPLFLPFVTLIAFAAGTGLTGLLRRVLLKRAVMDIPNDRSMHKTPVPRGGGLAVMGVVIGGLALFLGMTRFMVPQGWLLLAALLLVVVSWLDDRRGAGIVLRLGAHLLAALLGSLALPDEAILLKGFLPFWADRLVLIIVWAWFMNLYNFMDGIDGITGAETICIVTGVAVLFGVLSLNGPFSLILMALLLGACGGFLVFNWHPAKIFLGDVGSVPLGFLTGYLLLQLAAEGQRTAALILPLYYLADSGMTMGRRLLRGEKIWHAHRQHFYQRAAQGLGRHDSVVRWILATNLMLIVAALLATLIPWAGFSLAVVMVALLLSKMHKSALS